MDRRQMTLMLSDKEMTLLDQLAASRGMSKTALVSAGPPALPVRYRTDGQRRQGLRRASVYAREDRVDGAMKELLGEVDLYNLVSGANDKAQIYRELDQKNFDDFDQLWKTNFGKTADRNSDRGRGC